MEYLAAPDRIYRQKEEEILCVSELCPCSARFGDCPLLVPKSALHRDTEWSLQECGGNHFLKSYFDMRGEKSPVVPCHV